MQRDERLDLAFFFLADRDVIKALKNAASRGVCLRILLDPNKDSFGQAKHGIPNRPVAAELVRSGIEVRWSHTHGEQCHQKMMLGVNGKKMAKLLLGSANMTRRNLDDFNLETDVLIRAPLSTPVLTDVVLHFDDIWQNRPGQVCSVAYEYYCDESVVKRSLYRIMEATGFSTF
jgi:phosphatidylserine/phosphatidylglycerophosphate/cardiolipin synthase-like enzyme